MGRLLVLWTWASALILLCLCHLVPASKLTGSKARGTDEEVTQSDLTLATEYLQHFYDLKREPVRRRKRSDSALASKVREMQSFFGLNNTGNLDSETLEIMKAPRCGVPDVLEYANNKANKWSKTVLTYK
ncbi:hypothetical protein JZ751_012767 [Albula glossodonta]|uniref:Peptidoglycan binding-like domain-containing protein n=1 Tax=Albula glossodonta TaxID=121402 RepID=A0A8T2N6C3_9TELE|nr:hypothetical protein JZ751_012767 [Albula glossodonta]